MIRKQIYLEPGQNSALKHVADQSGVPEAEIIRQAIDLHLHTVRRARPNLALWVEERAFLDRLMAEPAPEDAARTWQRDELYER